jgi:hypothetical protein
MWLSRIKQTLHGLLNVRGYVPKLSMVDPVPRSIQGKRKVRYGISVDFVIELKEDTEASVCKDGMGGFGENMIV